MESTKVMTIKSYAENNRITRQTVYNWIKAGKIETVKIGSQQFIKV